MSTHIPFPSDLKYPLIEVFYLYGHEPFVCGVNGAVGNGMIEGIEKDLDENREFLDKGDGTYLYRTTWQEAQTGEYGRVEIPGYWDLELIRFQSVDDLARELTHQEEDQS